MLVAIESDQELILQYLNGDEKSFETLLNRHKNKIYTSIYLFVKDRDLADDMFQEVFIKIIDTIRKGRYNHEGKFSQWAMRIAYNLCVDQFRRNKRVPTLTPTDEFDVMDIVPAEEKNMEEEIIMSQTHSKLRKYVDSLPFEQREVVILRHFADLSFKEISQLTRVSINTSLGRMRYALINLRKMMEGVEAGFN
ncbi:MAG: sigma-70 family RNA polymerase sigma factor [Saprospiraceae bacterium]|jgi:RNA polymerase sigma-70 factor (ECF subfamily)|nr:sigma-70 family RNA polymerase sigma factor [Saprospiraceae bacterium]MBL0293463.1 sigma-70 family RNA polymerase sigma factor [Saprospiraceae bacterium]